MRAPRFLINFLHDGSLNRCNVGWMWPIYYLIAIHLKNRFICFSSEYHRPRSHFRQVHRFSAPQIERKICNMQRKKNKHKKIKATTPINRTKWVRKRKEKEKNSEQSTRKKRTCCICLGCEDDWNQSQM